MVIQLIIALSWLVAAVIAGQIALANDSQPIIIPKMHSGYTIIYSGDVPPPTMSQEESRKRYEQSAAAANKGVDFNIQKNYPDAVSWFTKAIEIDPTMSSAYWNRAVAYLQINQPDKALADINQTIKLRPTELRTYAIRVQILSALNRYDEALKNADALINHTPSAENFGIRAKLWEQLDDKPKAIKDWESAILSSEQSGEDAMDEVDALETLIGHKVERPKPPIEGCEELINIIAQIDKNKRRFDPEFIQDITTVNLHEVPITNRQTEHSCAFISSKGNGPFESVSVYTKLDPSDGSPCCRLTLNIYKVSATAGFVVKAFGVPDKIDDPERPSKYTYNRPWGTLTFHFYEHGFKSLIQIDFRIKKS